MRAGYRIAAAIWAMAAIGSGASQAAPPPPQPKLIVAMGQDALSCLNAVRFPLATEIASQPGSIQKFTPTIEALVTPDLDASLDEASAKKAFWEAFKAIGPWWSEQPPY